MKNRNKTYFPTAAQALDNRKWFVVDAANVPLGRVASQVASLILGKADPSYANHLEGGAFVVVINASKVVLTGKKAEQKIYYRHTGFIGGIKESKAGDILNKKPIDLIKIAVEGMLPDGVRGHRLAKRLKIYAGADHKHSSQRPTVVQLQYASAAA